MAEGGFVKKLKTMKKIILFSVLHLCSSLLWAQAAFQGGIGSGALSISLAGVDTCVNFYSGNAGSAVASTQYINPNTCGMFLGDSLSGAVFGQRSSTQNCIFFKGNQGSGYGNDLFDNSAACPAFYASSSGNDGYYARSYSEDAGICYFVALPIQASPLFAKIEDNKGYLYWYTYVEVNNAGFEIQKSYDGIHWESIGWINGEGDYTGELKYDFYDHKLLYRNQYYRTVQADYDGLLTISNIVSLHPSASNSKPNHIAIFPNPVRLGQDINIRSWISYELNVEYLIFNTLGQLMDKGTFLFDEYNNYYNLSTHNLSQGNYFLILRNEEGILSKQKIIVIE